MVATIETLFPAFASELEALLRRVGRADLVANLRDLPIVDRCQCRQAHCAHFYTAAPPAGSYGGDHSNLMLPAESGLIVLDILGRAIVAIEVSDRPDVKMHLDAHMPIRRKR